MLELLKKWQFIADFEEQFRRYELRGGSDLSQRFLVAVDETLELLRTHPEIGRLRGFRKAELRGWHSFLVTRPFNRYLIFYRFDESSLEALRLVHGARDLPRRLLEDPRNGE